MAPTTQQDATGLRGSKGMGGGMQNTISTKGVEGLYRRVDASMTKALRVHVPEYNST